MNSYAVAGFAILAQAGGKSSPEDETRAAHAEARLNLVSNPSLYLHATDHQFPADEGGTGEAQLTALMVSISSHFTGSDLEGDVIWLDGQDRRLGSTSFAL